MIILKDIHYQYKRKQKFSLKIDKLEIKDGEKMVVSEHV